MLTDKQRKFIQEYLVDLNATQAAMRAGYSKKTADRIGHENLKKLEIQKELQKAMNKRAKRTEITQDRVLQELAKIGFANITDFVSFGTGKTIVGYEDGEPVIDYAHVVTMKDSDEVDGAIISEVQLKDGQLKFKLHDKLKALQDIGRHLGMFNDKIDFNLHNLSDEQIAEQIRKLQNEE